MNVYGITLLAAVAVVLVVYIVDRVKGTNYLLYAVAGKPILSAAALLAKAVGAATDNDYFNTAYIVLDAATHATEKAEDLWKANKLPKDQRNEYANLMIKDTLKEAGIEVTEQVEEIIAGVIAFTCMLLPHHTDEEAKA